MHVESLLLIKIGLLIITFFYAGKFNLGGAYLFDSSQDTLDYTTGTFTYELANALHSGLGRDDGKVNICNAHTRCNVCHRCCKNYLTNQRDCDACAAIHCKANQQYNNRMI